MATLPSQSFDSFFQRVAPVCLDAAAIVCQFVHWPDRALRIAARAEAPVSFQLPFALMRRALGSSTRIVIPARALQTTLSFEQSFPCPEQLFKHYFVSRGNWRNPIPIQKTWCYQEMKVLAACNGGYKKTPWYEKRLAKLEQGRIRIINTVALDSPALLEEYCDRYVALIASIRDKGLIPLSALSMKDRLEKETAVRARPVEKKEMDIGVAIDEAGNIIRLHNALHRSSIAVILDLPAIPVEIRMIHRNWLRRLLAEHPGMPPLQVLANAFRAIEAQANAVPFPSPVVERRKAVCG